MITFKEYINEMTKFSVDQKNELNHFILNTLMNPETARLLKKTKNSKDNDITIPKKDAKVILDNLSKIREFIINLPRED